MPYLESFTLATDNQEYDYLRGAYQGAGYQTSMVCYDHSNVYPFKLFPPKGLKRLDFAPITILYGGNGSGKSTLLNVIAEKLHLQRSSPFNNTPYMKSYLDFCKYRLSLGSLPPPDSKIITSDDVFDYLLDLRSINEGVDRRREELYQEYAELAPRGASSDPSFLLKSLDDYDELKRRNEARGSTKSAFVGRRMTHHEMAGRSNGESALYYFTNKIGEGALYLLDEPENSLSAKLQNELRQFIEDSARFYRCQFIISTHSPFLLSMKGAKIYDLDSRPVEVARWTDLEAVRIYHDFFEAHRREF
ncbi:MAG: AAA family ATPase [Clostridia bacterium]|nr:AAA family ATPase [Clostridia bacterium]